MKIGQKNFLNSGHTYVMGILNATPDSFSDGGRYNAFDLAMFRAQKMVQDGADILDVGGESTRPGHTPVSAEAECVRVLSIIQGLKARFDVPVSIDTYKGSVAREAVSAGVDMLNDVMGLQFDDVMGRVAAENQLPIVLMHNRAEAIYHNFFAEVMDDVQATLLRAQNYGIKKEKIILDPGIGFVKNVKQNLELMRRLDEVGALGFPILFGASRKSVIGAVMGLPVDEREEGTLATTAAAMRAGAMFVRVHDVKANVRFIKMLEAIFAEECVK